MFWRTSIFFLLIVQNGFAQQKLHVKKQDNRFLFYQLSKQNDTIIANKNDLFLMKLPDSLQKQLTITIENGLLRRIYKDSLIYQLQYINGMKYSHQKIDSSYTTQLEGICSATKQITFSIYNNQKRKEVFRNLFWVK